jgi:Icc-related predicted phosphoesterase
MIYGVADLHGNLPAVPHDADYLLIAGDICPHAPPQFAHEQANWLNTEFRQWLEQLHLSGTQVIATWGNHDYIGERRYMVPELPWTLLVDDEAVLETREGSLRVWGTPWVPNLPRWAFYASEDGLRARADLIPEGTDILMTHGPPRGLGDFVPYNQKYADKYGTPPQGEHVGDPTLNGAIGRVQPSTVLCGHIHEARGWHFAGLTAIVNAAAVDQYYKLYPNPCIRIG